MYFEMNFSSWTTFSEQLKFISVIMGVNIVILLETYINATSILLLTTVSVSVVTTLASLIGRICFEKCTTNSLCMQNMEMLFHSCGGMLILLGGTLVAAPMDPGYYYPGNLRHFGMSAAILSFLDGSVHLLIGWLIYKETLKKETDATEPGEKPVKPFICFCGTSRGFQANREDLSPPPPTYSSLEINNV